MEEIIKEGIVQREKGYKYLINHKGDLVRKKESFLFSYQTLITILILIAAGSYYLDVSQARHYINSPCVVSCRTQEFANEFMVKNPNMQINCDMNGTYFTGSCMISGVKEDVGNFDNKGLNIIFKNE